MISVIAGVMCSMLALSNLAGSGSNSHDLMVVLCKFHHLWYCGWGK